MTAPTVNGAASASVESIPRSIVVFAVTEYTA